MSIRAAFFDVGDTLVEHWVPPERFRALTLETLRARLGEHEWYEAFLDAQLEPPDAGRTLRQETNRWYAEWFSGAGIAIENAAIDRLRSAMCVPLDRVSSMVPGAPEAVRWCKANGLRVVLVTNTFSRGDQEVWEDWRRLDLADAIDGVVSSHDAGWRKPHPAIFERALALAAVRADEAVMVGDRMDADVWGAKRLGMRAILRRTGQPQPEVDVVPDAVVSDLGEIPAIAAPWLDVRGAQPALSGPARFGLPSGESGEVDTA